MMTFNVWRKVKQKLRRGRRPMWQLACFLLAAGLLSPAFSGVGWPRRARTDRRTRQLPGRSGKRQAGA